MRIKKGNLVCKGYMRRCSTSLIIREMQIRATRRCHLTPVRMAMIKTNTNNKYWWACGEKGSLVHCWWGYKLVLPLWKTLWRFLKRKPEKLKAELPSKIPFLVCIQKKSTNWKERYVHPNVHSSIIYNCQDMEAIHMSIHIRMDKEDIVYIYWRRKWQSTQYSCLENPVDRGAWRAAVRGVAQSRTRLKRLSMNACIGEGNSNLLQCSCLENPRDRGAWWAAIYGVVQSWTWLKQNSSSSSSSSVYIIYTLNTTHP